MTPKTKRVLWGLLAAAALYQFLWTFDRRIFGSGTTHLEWQENVQLSSGATIAIERDVKFSWSRDLSGTRSGDITRRSVLRSAHTPPLFPEWSAPMMPVVLHQDASGTWWIIASTNNCEFWQRNMEPLPPYWAFVSDGTRWYRTAMPEFAWGRHANLFVRYEFDDTDRTLRDQIAVRKANQSPHPERDLTAEVRKNMEFFCSHSTGPQEVPYERDLQTFGRR